MNEIKLDSLGLPITHGKIEKNTKKPDAAPQQEEVSVTNHLSQLVSLLADGQPAVEDQARVLEMKQRVQTGGYSVDIDALSAKLLTSGVLNV